MMKRHYVTFARGGSTPVEGAIPPGNAPAIGVDGEGAEPDNMAGDAPFS